MEHQLEQRDGGQRPLRAQAARSRDRRHRRPGERQRGLHHRQPRRRARRPSSTSLRHERVPPQEPGGVFPANATLITMPKATRNYNSVEFALEKRFSNRWCCMAATRGAATPATTRVSRRRTRTAATTRTTRATSTIPSMTFDQTGKVIDGVFDTDRTHQIKAAGDLPVQVGHVDRPEPVPVERHADQPPGAGHFARQLSDPLPRTEQRRPDADVLAVGRLRRRTRSPSAGRGRSS